MVLLSGGLDSATVLAIAEDQGYQTHALTVRYGQRHDAEIAAARAVVAAACVARHLEVAVDLGAIGGSALTDDIPVPPADDPERPEDGIPVTYVPARNTVLLSLALAWAEVLGADDIFIGVNAIDYSGYPDCRPAFIEAFEGLANLATKSGVGGSAIHIHAPLIDLSKSEIILLGTALGVHYGLTMSCYDPGQGDAACGRCEACALRRAGFIQAGVADPTRYVPNR